MSKELFLPRRTGYLINSYFNLPIAGKKIRCPYYKNVGVSQKRFGKKVFIGKSHPQEIVLIVQSLAEKFDIKLEDLSASEIRDFMKERRIGIDCSGFVCWVLDSWYQEKFNGEHLWKKIRFPASFLKKIRYFLRPIENLDVKILLGSPDLKPVFGAAEIKPGDLIHLGQHHLLIVYQVDKDAKERTTKIFYCHSSDFYDGVHKGEIEVVDPDYGLEKQRWVEGKDGRNWSFEEYLRSNKSGIFRLILFNRKK